jgi:hypothetical protein
MLRLASKLGTRSGQMEDIKSIHIIIFMRFYEIRILV